MMDEGNGTEGRSQKLRTTRIGCSLQNFLNFVEQKFYQFFPGAYSMILPFFSSK
jgi:hypothetical protein